jgi:hypothetical protein
MRDVLRPAVRLLMTSVLVLATSAVIAAPAGAQAGGGCVLKITRFEWHPRMVHAGDRTKLHLKARNCTDRTLHLTVTKYGKRIPPCPTLDPIGGPVNLTPHARYDPRPLLMIAPPCNGVETMVVFFSDSHGNVIARRTATVRIVDP